eukprot:1523798-Rhodomonas_salina.4
MLCAAVIAGGRAGGVQSSEASRPQQLQAWDVCDAEACRHDGALHPARAPKPGWVMGVGSRVGGEGLGVRGSPSFPGIDGAYMLVPDNHIRVLGASSLSKV